MTQQMMDPATRFVRSLPGEYFMTREAAAMLGVPRRRLDEYVASYPDELGPSFCTFFGKLKIYLYTQEDIERIRAHLTNVRRVFPPRTPGAGGRPRKWTDEERKERQRLYAKRHYYHRRIEESIGPEDKAHYQNKLSEVQRLLDRKPA